MDKNNISIALIQEPYVIRDKVCGFSFEFDLFYVNSAQKPKTAIAIRKSRFIAFCINSFTTPELTIVQIVCEAKKILLFSAYCPPTNDLNVLKHQLNQIQRAIEAINPMYLLIAMDSNSHSRVWYDRRDDQRGYEILDFIANNNLIILNNNQNTPTFETNNRKSSIDLTLINNCFANYVHNWTLLDIDSQSDHKFIVIEFSDRVPQIKFKSTLKYNSKTTNWESFLCEYKHKLIELNNDLNTCNNVSLLDSFVLKYTTMLCELCEKFMAKFKPKRDRRMNKWWTQELSSIRRQVNTARRRYQRCQTYRRPQLRDQYTAIDRKYKQLIDKNKTNSFNAFISESSAENPWGLAYRIAKDKIFAPILSELVNTDGNLIIDEKMIAKEIFDKLFPNDDQNTENAFHKQIRAQSLMHSDGTDDSPFSEQEVTAAVLAQNPNKAPGADGLTADIIHKTHNCDQHFLTNLYNKCLQMSYFPLQWKKSIIKIIPKPNKNDYTDPNAYRPISLLPVHAKIFEKLLINRITYYLFSNSLISQRQYGFTPQRSTEDALNSVINFVKKAFERKGMAMIVSLDISGAFNSCWWPKIINSLRLKCCPNNLLSVVKSYFNDRESNLWYLNTETKRQMTAGCPQGSASGPWFWNVSIDDIFQLNDGEDCVIECFADDTIAMIFAQNSDELERKVNNKLCQLMDWSKSNKLRFNVSKTNCTLFTKKLKFRKPYIVFDNQKLELVSHFKHLGVIIDSKLTWRPHVNYIKAKALQLTNNLLRFAKSKYGIGSKALEVIFKGAVLPTIGYAISVWIEAIDRKFVIKPLEQIQRLIAIRIAKAYRTVSYQSINVIANTLPIDLWLKAKAVECFVKKNINNDLVDSYLGGTGIELDSIQRETDFKLLLPFHQRQGISILSEATAIYGSTYDLYIESSKDEESVGSAYLIQSCGNVLLKKKLKMSGFCTLFQSRLWALFRATEAIIAKKWHSIDFIIKIRDKALIFGIKNANSKTFIITKLFENINHLKQNNIRFFSHFSSTEELLDAKRLAKEAAASHQRIDFDLIAISFVKRKIREKSVELWNNRWCESGARSQTAKYFPTIKDRQMTKKWFKQDDKLCQALTNHGAMNAYLKRFHIKDSNLCEKCGEGPDDSEHRLLICDYYSDKRQDLIDQLRNEGYEWPVAYNMLIKANAFNHFLNFCKNVF
jgi:hypothetical protein